MMICRRRDRQHPLLQHQSGVNGSGHLAREDGSIPGSLDLKRLERLRVALEQRVKDGIVGGCSAAVWQHGERVFAHCAGDIQEDSICRVASMTKLVLSVAVLTLVEEGRLFLDEDLTMNYLKEFRDTKVLSKDLQEVKRKNPITMRQLLTHTSGFVYQWVEPSGNEEVAGQISELVRRYKEVGMFDGLPMSKEHTQKNFLERLLKCPLAFEPGTHYIYGLGFDVAGIVVERITGQKLGEVMKERIFDPLGMKDTGFHVSSEKVPRMAPLYIKEDMNKDLREVPVDKANMAWCSEDLFMSGGGGLCSTMADYGAFVESVVRSIRGDGPRGKIRPLLARSTAALIAGQAVPDTLPRTDLPPGLGQSLACQTIEDPAKVGDPQPKGSIYVRGFVGTKGIMNAEYGITGVLLVQKIKHADEGPDLRHVFPTLVYQALV